MDKRTAITLFVLLVSLNLLLSACGITGRAGMPTDMDDYSDLHLLESGIASWYGPNFHGKQTANGERYNMNDLTAAHRTLPFNTYVQVVNLENGRVVSVRINDRGPYVGDRVIDLSRKAAQEIDMIDSGTAPVEILLIEEGDRPITTSNSSSRETFTVQIASFDIRSRAENKASGIDGARVERVSVSGNIFYRVYYGTFDNPDDAATAMRQLRRKGIDGFVKQMEN